ncbi:ABC transporter permease [Arthrobacter sp. NIO-1057]|uniref:ABC transporter permease n=1 Tax=Arthrobacter sp. NIO-1057 TaxID=993071 RepID=UPI00071C9283|nr:ABC transporter permease subunit [Arthrobacter sp. NIO-1057]KSU66374.1 glycine/betaine ABC transporter permease [Arthrobacter sp. NIO-1057]SCC12433.1 osmoprotectant transport system permease protein [Arthrobacter sp. NIO-1057]
MNLISDAIAWLFAPEQWEGKDGLQTLLGEHLLFTVLSVLIAGVIAIPAGWAIGHTGKGREIAVAAAGIARAVPSFGLLILLVLLFGVTHKPAAALVSFVVLAIPSLLAGAYTGFEAIDRKTIDAARAMGMTEWQVLLKVEIPLGLSLLVGGLRAATLQVVATVTIAAYVNLGGLGLPIITGLNLRRFDMVLGGSLMVAVLALLLDLVLAIVQKASVPRGLVHRRTTTKNHDADHLPVQDEELT